MFVWGPERSGDHKGVRRERDSEERERESEERERERESCSSSSACTPSPCYGLFGLLGSLPHTK